MTAKSPIARQIIAGLMTGSFLASQSAAAYAQVAPTAQPAPSPEARAHLEDSRETLELALGAKLQRLGL